MLDLDFVFAGGLLSRARAFDNTHINDKLAALDAASRSFSGKVGLLWVTEH